MMCVMARDRFRQPLLDVLETGLAVPARFPFLLLIPPNEIRKTFHRIERICVCHGTFFQKRWCQVNVKGAIIDCLETYLTFRTISIISKELVLKTNERAWPSMGWLAGLSSKETENMRNYRIIDVPRRIEIDDGAVSCFSIVRGAPVNYFYSSRHLKGSEAERCTRAIR